jgi:UDP-N-acetylglucosamine/UDP-N-acetyl-alpha-D-glucosaminouronate 4-epimerase
VSLQDSLQTWLITGVAGFIGSNLLERLIAMGQNVVGLDNFSTGHWHNLDDVMVQVGESAWKRFQFIEGDISNLRDCQKACNGVDYVLHQAALGSVPRSIEDPLGTHQSNVDGFIKMLIAANDAKVRCFVYASSSSVYGDDPTLPKHESVTGSLLSPYAATKHIDEIYADVFARSYGIKCIGLRYFNVFGPRQDPNGAYAAVIPRWINELLSGKIPSIYGDGETSRDFCYIDNVVQANLLSAETENLAASNQVFNIAAGHRTTLNELFTIIQENLAAYDPNIRTIVPLHGPFRPGDVRHSHADISKAKTLLGYNPTYDVRRGLGETVKWFTERYKTLQS